MLPHKKTILLTQSQASHFVNMHKPWIQYSSAAADVYNTADDVLYSLLNNRRLTDLLSSELAIQEPVVQQVGIFTTTYASYRALLDKNILREDDVLAASGFSLGEIAALTIIGMISLNDALIYVTKRAYALLEASTQVDSQLIVTYGCVEATVQSLLDECRKPNEVLTIINKTAEISFCVCGHKVAVQRVVEKVKTIEQLGVKTFDIPAVHSSLMEPAREKLRVAIQELHIKEGRGKCVALSSCTTDIFTKENARDLLEAQLTTRLRWNECLEWLIEMGQKEDAQIVELAPGNMHSNIARYFTPPYDLINQGLPPE